MRVSRFVCVGLFGVMTMPLLFGQGRDQDFRSDAKKLTDLMNQARKDAVNQKDIEARRRAFETFESLTQQISPTITNLCIGLRDSDSYVRVSAVKSLASLGPSAWRAVPDLVEALEKDKSSDVRTFTCGALGAVLFEGSNPYQAKVVVPALVKALRTDDNVFVRRRACYAFQMIGTPAKDAAPTLLHVMKETEDPVLREIASRSFYEVVTPDWAKLAPGLIAMLKAGIEHEDVRVSAWIALRKIEYKGADILPFLVEKLKQSPRLEERAAAALVIGKIGPMAASAVPDLLATLDLIAVEKDRRTRARLQQSMLTAIGGIGPDAKQAIPALRRLASDGKTDLDVREAAERVLAIIQR